MDRLTALLRHFELRSQLYFSGRKCGVMDFGDDDGLGHVHVLRAGTLTLVGPDGNAVVLDVPTVLFCPYPTTHRLQIDPPLEAELVCASLSFGHADGNAVLRSLPSPLLVPLTALPQQGRLLDLLFDEAFGAYCGHQAAVDRLMEVLVIQLLRHAMRNGLADSGTLAGLADPRLSKALVALHGDPAAQWSLEKLAAQAGMSRARFAARFAEVTGLTPGDYVATWRIGVAQRLLRKGTPLVQVAEAVGYSGTSALSRMFTQHVGQSPRQWLRTQQTRVGDDPHGQLQQSPPS